MSTSIIVQYIGFQAKSLSREYTFHVRGAAEERDFTLNIANEAFISHRARYQDAPAICSERLQAELAAHSNNPAETQFVITAAELDSYRAARSPKTPQKLWGRKPTEDF
jgi:hypothetical protein